MRGPDVSLRGQRAEPWQTVPGTRNLIARVTALRFCLNLKRALLDFHLAGNTLDITLLWDVAYDVNKRISIMLPTN